MTDKTERRPEGADLIPLILIVLSLFVLMVFETVQAIDGRATLTELRLGQQQTVAQATRLRLQLQALARQTAALADQGDAGAKAVVDQMKRQGVTLSSPKS